jgi:hypothetical protein
MIISANYLESNQFYNQLKQIYFEVLNIFNTNNGFKSKDN